MTAALAGTLVAGLAVAAAGGGVALVAAMTVLGAVGGAYYSPSTSLLADRFDATERTIGVHRLGAQAVGVTGPAVAAVASVAGWRVTLALGAAVAVPPLVGFAALSSGGARRPNRGETTLAGRLAPERMAGLLGRPSIGFTTAVAALAQFADTATFSFLPAILREHHGASPTLAGTLFAGYFLAMTVAQPSAGWLADRVGRDPTAVGALAVGVVGYGLLAAADGTAALGAGVALVGAGM